ncbi:MAG: magnesium transporter [Spirochaetota bacterium]|jgi:magnesium transporter|nr:magnesium transporter [Spirochaetota bacterium]
MMDSLLTPDVLEFLESGETKAIQEFCADTTPAVVAECIAALTPDKLREILLLCPREEQAEIFSFLDFEQQRLLLQQLKRREIAHILTDMAPDDRADLFKRLPEEEGEDILPALAQAEREDIRRLSSYEEGTAGAVMTSDYATLSANITAAQAIEHLRNEALDKEMIYYSYVIDRQRRLLGSVSLQDLIVAKRSETVEEIMYTDTIFTRAHDDQEDAARKIRLYDLLSIPVVDAEGALVGIITCDDAIDVITQEQTEDIEKLVAVAGSHETGVYMRTSSWKHFTNRSIWVAALAVLGLVSGLIIQGYEKILAEFTILAAFIPMLADSGGNTGCQASTLVIRALALKEISPRDALFVLVKEFRVGLLLGLLLGVIAYLRVIIFGGGSTMPPDASLALVGLSISVALCLQVITATIIGALLPFIASWFKCDPAVIASPALTTIVDITGLLIYFTTASLFLSIG